jgi:hypothetical protein
MCPRLSQVENKPRSRLIVPIVCPNPPEQEIGAYKDYDVECQPYHLGLFIGSGERQMKNPGSPKLGGTKCGPFSPQFTHLSGANFGLVCFFFFF